MLPLLPGNGIFATFVIGTSYLESPATITCTLNCKCISYILTSYITAVVFVKIFLDVFQHIRTRGNCSVMWMNSGRYPPL